MGWLACICLMVSCVKDDNTREFEDLPKVTFTVNGVSFTMIKVAGGTFLMGATKTQDKEADDLEAPVHPVTLSDFYIGETEVTQSLWQAVMGNNPSYFQGENLPVENVTWFECDTFVKKICALTGKKFLLPSEAEWEYAARGGNQSKGFKYSGSNNINDVAWYQYYSKYQTHPVGELNPNELGIYDMSGNVWERCRDNFSLYSDTAQINPEGEGPYNANRGGNIHTPSWCCRSTARSNCLFTYRYSDGGLRLALHLH